MASALLASVPFAAWGTFAAVTGTAMVIGLWPHLRRAFHQWRLDRRIAQDSGLLREELRDYEWAIGDELPPLAPRRLLSGALLAGAWSGLPVWLEANGLEDWWLAAGVAVFALGLLTGLWRWLNDPESKPAGEALADNGITVTTLAGAAGALMLTGVLLLAMAAI